MAISAISSALPVRSNNVAFSGKKNEGNDKSVSNPQKISSMKTIPVVVLMTLSPSLLNSAVINNEGMAEWDPAKVEYVGDDYASTNVKNSKIISSKTFGESTINLISVDGNDNNYEEIEIVRRGNGNVTGRGIIKAIKYLDEGGNPSASIAGLALPKEDLDNYNINDTKGPKYLSCMAAGDKMINYIKEILASKNNASGVLCDGTLAPLRNVRTNLTKEVAKYKAVHGLE